MALENTQCCRPLYFFWFLIAIIWVDPVNARAQGFGIRAPMRTFPPPSSSCSCSCSSSPTPLPPPPPPTTWRHHGFLNFRGLDVCNTFADHLYEALVRKGIKAFRDDRDLPRGENITEAIPRAIEESKFSIVVLSRNYASSEWCLDELVKIMQCRIENGHQTFPVFYDLSPKEVVNLSGIYKGDFDRHQKKYSYERVASWKHALSSIGDISGWESKIYRSEEELVERIASNMLLKVQEVTRDSTSVWSLLVGLMSVSVQYGVVV